jgi:glycosyltransferase involved in cell wall biosynthesis
MSQGELPLVSVVIPCFNQAHFLGDAIDAALAQTYPRIEVVVVDDGSGDNTWAVAGREAGVRRLRQGNGGVASARNLGLREASGDCLVFLDADDRLLPDAVQTGMDALLKRLQVAFVAGMCRDIDVAGQRREERPQPLVTQDHYLRLLEDCYIWSGSSIVYRRSALDAVGGFDEGLPAGDDYDLYLRLTHRFPVYCHDAVVTEYRRHGSNTTRDSAVVLTSQLAVLRRQRPLVRGRRERAAYRKGVRNTRGEHGHALSQQAIANWKAGRRRRALRDLRTLAQYDPRSLARAVLRRGQ